MPTRQPLPPPLADYDKCRVVGPLTRDEKGRCWIPVQCKLCSPEQVRTRLVIYNRAVFIERGGTYCAEHGSRLGTTHGMCGTPTYNSYRGMLDRVRNNKDYKRKRRRCAPEWMASFERFLETMGPRPAGTSLERVDNSQGYGMIHSQSGELINNCTWATPLQQSNNTDANRHINVGGDLLTIAQAARALNVNVGQLRYVVRRYSCTMADEAMRHVRHIEQKHIRAGGRRH